MRNVLRARNHRTTALVTHDPLDALVLADRVLVLAAGAIVEQGSTREVLVAGISVGALTMREPAVAVFRPAAVAVHLERTHGSPRNVLAVKATEVAVYPLAGES